MDHPKFQKFQCQNIFCIIYGKYQQHFNFLSQGHKICIFSSLKKDTQRQSSSVETYFGLYMEVDSNILIFRLRVIKLIFPQYWRKLSKDEVPVSNLILDYMEISIFCLSHKINFFHHWSKISKQLELKQCKQQQQ